MIQLKLISAIAACAVFGIQDARAGDTLKITIPRHSELTPVQRLNREGVDAVKKHQYEKAATFFYKAYLYDPSDPFTLNNLGYISELQGELDRANRFYALASEQGSTANIDLSSSKQLLGKPMQSALDTLQNVPMRVNRMNVQAMEFLSQHRGVEAISLLRKTLALDEHNPFTLNNLGVAHESIGDFENALKSYGEAVEQHSSEPVVVTLDRAWRGRPVSEMAGESARRLKERIKKMDSAELNAATFTLHGVSLANQNDWLGAKNDFLQAYSTNPASAFSLNNRGYVAEMEGDLETAGYFYDKARHASDSNVRVGQATQQAAEGKKLSGVAAGSNHDVRGQLDIYSQDRHRQTGPIELTPRGNPSGVNSGAMPNNSESPDVLSAPATNVPQPN